MSRLLPTVALIAAIAGPAAAQEIRLELAGKSEAAARQEIRRAVEQVCQAADRQGAFRGVYTLQNCLMDGESRGMAQFEANQHAAAQVTALAANDAATPRR
jgi:hypothetical protein